MRGPAGSLSLKLSDTRFYESQIRARLGTTAQLCKAGILQVRTAEAHHLFDHRGSRKVNIRLAEKENSNSHGAKSVHQIISMIQLIRASRLSFKLSLWLRLITCSIVLEAAKHFNLRNTDTSRQLVKSGHITSNQKSGPSTSI